jgi:hypothetical protein
MYRSVEGRENAELTERLCIDKNWSGCAVKCARVSEVSPKQHDMSTCERFLLTIKEINV